MSDFKAESDEYLVVFTYKGHTDSIVLTATSDTVEQELRRRGIKGGIDEIYSPGSWHYDPETNVPIPN